LTGKYRDTLRGSYRVFAACDKVFTRLENRLNRIQRNLKAAEKQEKIICAGLSTVPTIQVDKCGFKSSAIIYCLGKYRRCPVSLQITQVLLMSSANEKIASLLDKEIIKIIHLNGNFLIFEPASIVNCMKINIHVDLIGPCPRLLVSEKVPHLTVSNDVN